MSKIIIIGGGAAGMMAACAAAKAGAEVTLYEKNEKLGKKIFITGKGRCNLTNACDTQELFDNIPRNAKFLYSAIYSYDNFQVMDFFEQNGTKLKVERGNRVFPVSDHSSDVIAALKRAMERLGVKVVLNTAVLGIVTKKDESGRECVCGVKLPDHRQEPAAAVIVATGGCSYCSTGSTGDGYRFAQELGHEVTKRRPSLVPFTAKEDYVKQLMGLSLKNVRVSISNGKKQLFSDFGEMLFTHFGVSGPLLLSASSIVNDAVAKGELHMEIDLKPALTEEQLDKRILREFENAPNKQFVNAVGSLYPSKLTPVVIMLSGIPSEKRVNEITRNERERLIKITKHFPVTLTGLRGFEEAIITRGGVSVRQVNPSTMESKLTKGLYFAGELLDVDALTGGFNLQIAWSSGYLAGSAAAEQTQEA